MELLVLNEKNHTRYFLPDEHGSFNDVFVKVIKERLDEAWYEDDDALTAQGLVDDYQVGEDVSLEILKFMRSRKSHEYEDWELALTDN